MPWTAAEFRRRHAKALSVVQARRAVRVANAIVRGGGDEGVAIATGIARARERGWGTREAELRRRKER